MVTERDFGSAEGLWVPEGSLAGFGGGLFEVWPAPGAREGPPKKGGDAPHIFEGIRGPSEPARPQKKTQKPGQLPSSTQVWGAPPKDLELAWAVLGGHKTHL